MLGEVQEEEVVEPVVEVAEVAVDGSTLKIRFCGVYNHTEQQYTIQLSSEVVSRSLGPFSYVII